VLWLSLAQLISWGTLFYTFSLLLEHLERDLSLTRIDAALAFSIALMTEGVLAIAVGRLIDAGRARAVMCAGSMVAAASLIGCAFVSNQTQLYITWIGVGIAMSGTLYQPAFSLLIRRYPQDFRRAIITLTFLGGLASTVFIPLGAWLISSFGWRHALIALGSLHLIICLPIHAYWLSGEPVAASHSTTAPVKKLIEFTHHFPFWGLALFFILFSGITTAIGAHLVPILRERDLPPGWAIAIPASIGLLQVAGRLLLFFTEKHLDVHQANRWIPTLLPVALCTLALGLREPAIAIVFALLYGMANGMITIVKATAMATYVSRERAASLNGLLGLPTALSRAVAPSALAALWTLSGSYIAGLWALSALGAAAVIAFWAAQRRALR
jgi:MFS family permease